MSMTPRLLTIQGRTMSMTQWSREPGAVKYIIIAQRLSKGWDDEPAVFKPAIPRAKKRIRLVGVNRPSRAVRAVRPAPVLAPNPRQANPHPPTWGGFSSWPIEALEMLRRCA